MTSIFTQYDPEWEAYKASMGPGPIQTAQEKADQEKLNASLQNLYSQSLESRNYLTPDQFNAMFPGVKKWGQEQSDWQKQLEEGFTKKYGHSPILSTSIQGPRNLLNSTQAPVVSPQDAPKAWNAGDVWDMNRAPQDVVDSMKKYAETHDEKYYQSQIPTPAGPLLTAPVTPPTTTIPTVPSVTSTITPPAVIPPATSSLSNNLLVNPPGATAQQNEMASLQNLLGRSAVGGVGSFKMPDFFKQTQQKWGGFSPVAFSKR